MRYFRFTLTGLTLTGLTATALLVACGESTNPRQTSRPAVGDPSFTAGVGFVGTRVARGNAGVFHIRSRANGYHVEINAKENTDIAVSNIVIAPGGHSGWHSHPGPVFVVVKTGTITHYEASRHGDDQNGDEENGNDEKGNHATCTRTVYPAGTVFIEVGGEVHIARNEGNSEATLTATFFAPKGAALSIDQPAPGGNCPS